MEIKEEIKRINKEEIVTIYNNLKNENVKQIRLDKSSKYIFTIKKFEVFLRLYVDENIQVFIRTNTLNSREKVNYSFVNINNIEVDNIEEYRKNIKLFYENIIKEAINTVYTVESHNEMIPTNATLEEKTKNWCTIYEQRLLTNLNYNDMNKFQEWLNKVTDKKYIEEQKHY